MYGKYYAIDSLWSDNVIYTLTLLLKIFLNLHYNTLHSTSKYLRNLKIHIGGMGVYMAIHCKIIIFFTL